MAWNSHLFKNFLQFFVIHTVKVFSIAKEAEEVFFVFFFFLKNVLAFSMIQQMFALCSLVPLPFLNLA